jgi:AcrR family transcriptional regulator
MADEKRTYRKTRRADLEAETRLRITESAVALHGTLGPSRTSLSAIAEHAGVRRSTVYRHFPDEAALFAACSAHWRAAHPEPDLGRWAAVADPDERFRAALTELYGYYRGTEAMWENILRDEPLLPAVRGQAAGFHDYLGEAVRVLMRGRGLRGAAAPRVRAAIGLALAFSTWHSLARGEGLEDGDAADLMCRLAACARSLSHS